MKFQVQSSKFKVCCFVAAIVVLIAIPAQAQSAKEVLTRAGRHYDAINDYTAEAKITVISEAINIPEMNVTMYYKKPDKLHIESKDGFAIIPRRGTIIGNPIRGLLAGKDVSILRSEKLSGMDCFVIKGSFEDDDGGVTESTVWIDKKDWLVRRIDGKPEWGPSVRFDIRYTKAARKYWVPSYTEATVSLPPTRAASRPTKASEPMIVKLRFSNYRVNTGLKDSIFQKRDGGK